MPTKEDYFEQIEKEFAMAREALAVGNDGKARVCARRAVGQAITWFLSKHPHPSWGRDAFRQLQHLKDDETFPIEIRQAAVRLTTKVSDQYLYPFTTDPLEDARLIIAYIEALMNSHGR